MTRAEDAKAEGEEGHDDYRSDHAGEDDTEGDAEKATEVALAVSR